MSGIFFNSVKFFGEYAGKSNSISSWVAIIPLKDLQGYCENISTKTAFSITKQLIAQSPVYYKLTLREVLTNNVIDQISKAKARIDYPAKYEKMIRFAMETLVEADGNAEMDDY